MNEKLTPRETEILKCSLLSEKEAAEALSLKESTVKTHRNNIYQKWHLKGATVLTKALVKALKDKVITLDDLIDPDTVKKTGVEILKKELIKRGYKSETYLIERKPYKATSDEVVRAVGGINCPFGGVVLNRLERDGVIKELVKIYLD